MGALPNVTPRPSKSTTRKQPERAGTPAGKCVPRTRKEIGDSLRRGTDYDKGVGWYRLFGSFFVDRVRLSSGLTCTNLLDFIWQDIQAKGDAVPAESRALDVAEMAVFLAVDERSINRELAYLQERGMATVARLTGGKVVVELKVRDWSRIQPDYQQWAEERRKSLDEQAAESAEETPLEQPVKPGTVALTKKPVLVRGGCSSRTIKVETGVSGLKFEWQYTPVDFQFLAAVHSGELVLTGSLVEQKENEKSFKSNRNAKRVESKVSRGSLGHTCPDNDFSIPANEGRGGQSAERSRGRQSRPSPVHPRGEELAKLFDPLIFQHCKKTLSGDPVALVQSCDLIGETPYQFVEAAAKERASRKLLPSHVPALCREIEHNWRMGKGMPEFCPPTDKHKARSQAVRAGLDLLDEIRRSKKS